MKFSKNKKEKKANVKKSRKQLRKEKRQQKKVRKHEYYTNRNKPGKFVLKPPSDDSDIEQNVEEIKNGQNKKKRVKQVVEKKSLVDQQSKDVAKEKREQQKLASQMQKQRIKQLMQANVEEDRNIKMLEKQLNLNKRKTKSIPKSFATDGLDFLLEVCDRENMESIVAAEKQMNDGDDEFEEDFALMSGKNIVENSSDDDDDESIHSEEEEDDDIYKNGLKRKKGKEKIVSKNNKKMRKEEDDVEMDEDDNEAMDENDDEIDEEDDEDMYGDDDGETDEDNGEFDEEYASSESNEFEKKTKNVKSKEKKKSKTSHDGNFDDKSQGTDSNDDGSGEEITDEEVDIENINSKENISNSDEDFDDENEGMNSNDDECGGEISNGVDDDDRDSSKQKNKNGTWEDIYGRLRDKDGNVVNETSQKYIPPAVRAKMEAGLSDDKKKLEKLNRLKRQLKGLLNRLAESNMYSISNQIEELYMQNSRHEMNDALTSLIFDSLVTGVNTPERLLLEHVLLITVLHSNVGTEVGAHFLQTVIKRFDDLTQTEQPIESKCLDNIVNIISQLYNFKVFHSQLLYQVLERLYCNFTEKNVECILLVLKNVGFTMRKDDPLALKDLILNLQKKAASASADVKDNPRVKFMLEILLAIKNNNMNKIPNYDTSYSEHLKKIMKGFIRKGNYVTQLNISLDDLIKAEERGKWWVVGSAWTGKIGEKEEKTAGKEKVAAGYSQKLLDLAKKQRMNTDARRNIFCTIMSAEDYMDAFEKLLHLNLKNQQEREIINVLLHCCLQEKTYNPYYSVLAQKFCDHDRKFQMTIKYSIWDKLKALTNCSGPQISNLAKLLTHLFLEKGLPISVLKVVQFGELDKVTLRFMRQILLGVLLCENLEQCQEVFERVAHSDKLKMFRERLRLFIHHFLLRNVKDAKQKSLLEERTKIAEKMLTINDKKVKF